MVSVKRPIITMEGVELKRAPRANCICIGDDVYQSDRLCFCKACSVGFVILPSREKEYHCEEEFRQLIKERQANDRRK